MSLHFIRVYLYVKMILGENYFKFIRLLNVFTFLRIKVILLEQFKNKKTILTTYNDFYQLLVKLIFLCLNFSSQIALQ